MKFFGPVESIDFGIGVQQKILHKSIFVIFFCVGSEQGENLTYGKFPDGRNRVAASPDNEKIRKFAAILNFVQTETGIGSAESGAVAKFLKCIRGWKLPVTCSYIYFIVGIDHAEIQLTDLFPVVETFF